MKIIFKHSVPFSHKKSLVSIKHTNRLMLFSGCIAVSVRIMHNFATAQCRYSKWRGYTSTYVKFEDREYQGTDSARCAQGCACEYHGGRQMRWYSTTNVVRYPKVRGLNLGYSNANPGRRFSLLPSLSKS